MRVVINSIIENMIGKYRDFANTWRINDTVRLFCVHNFKNFDKLIKLSDYSVDINEFDSFVNYVTARNLNSFIEGTFLENYNDRCEPFDFSKSYGYYGSNLTQLNKNWFEKECTEWDKVREKLITSLNHSWNGKHACSNSDNLFLAVLLKEKSPEDYKTLISSFPIKGKRPAFYHRGFTAYCELITAKELKPAEVRPYRSEASGCAWLVVNALINNKNFNDAKKTLLLSKFADCKHEEVIRYIVSNCPKSALTYFVSNPHAISSYDIKNKLRERMNTQV